jgi:septal ring factor EnvC (AmiA/AmiB activator)
MSIDQLRSDFEQAQNRARELMAEKDRVRDELIEANAQAAAAQKALADAEVLEVALDRDDLTPEDALRIAPGLGTDAAKKLLDAKLEQS